jgi:hypothetical protein
MLSLREKFNIYIRKLTAILITTQTLAKHT